MPARRICPVLSFGLGGHVEHLLTLGGWQGRPAESTLSGYDSPENWTPDEGTDYSDCMVIDLRAVVTVRPSLSFRSPLYTPRLADEEIDRCPDLAGSMVAQAFMEAGDPVSKTAIALQLAHGSKPSAGPMDSVGRALYINYWRTAGAQIGRVQAGAIRWET